VTRPGAQDAASDGADLEAARRRAEQERRRQQVFGDVLDGSTLDDRPEPGPAVAGDSWLRDNVPPHHGD